MLSLLDESGEVHNNLAEIETSVLFILITYISGQHGRPGYETMPQNPGVAFLQ